MKIVDRKTFLQMPKGTVFCPIPLGDNGMRYISIDEAYILDEHDSEMEYFKARLGFMTSVDGDSSDAYFDMENGKERDYEPLIVDTDVSENHKDTLYDIFSAKEVQSLIDQLQQALEEGYDLNPQNKESVEA